MDLLGQRLFASPCELQLHWHIVTIVNWSGSVVSRGAPSPILLLICWKVHYSASMQWSNGLPSQSPFNGSLRRLVEVDFPLPVDQIPLPLQGLTEALVQASSECWACCEVAGTVRVIAVRGGEVSAPLRPASWISFLAVISGDVAVRLPSGSLRCGAGQGLLLAGGVQHWRSSAFDVICLMVSPRDLLKVCAEVSPEFQQGPAMADLWERSRCCRSEQGGVDALLIADLGRSLQTMGDSLRAMPAAVDQLGLGYRLARVMALLAFPSLWAEPSAAHEQEQMSCHVDDFDALISYIQANLDQPLNLTVLQSRLCYSRRAVQYAFRQRLGCTASQWIRSQRLDKARQLLALAAPGTSVAAVAQACGYRSMSLFSIDFQQRFHVKPSTLLREARLDGDSMTAVDGLLRSSSVAPPGFLDGS
jgi:AraC-like DNA-binding protein